MASAQHRADTLEVVERAHEVLGLTYKEIARVIAADESSLHRWRRGDASPSPVFRRQLAALGRCLDLMERAFGDWEAARAWLDTDCKGLDGARPAQVLLAGEIDRVTPLLFARDSHTHS